MSSRPRYPAMSRRQLDSAIDRRVLAKVNERPARGWVAAIRSALGMTTRQLATRLGIRQPSLLALEKSEVAGTVSLNTLRRAADALECDLVYVLVPRRPLDETVKRQARALAEAEVARTSHSMRLEGQGVSARKCEAEIRRLAAILEHQGSRLWRDD